MDHQASIAIFQREIEYPEGSRPIVPDEIFETVLRVIKNKSCEVVKSRNGLYIIRYSETGPWQEKEVAEEYLPVWIARVSSWSSGGIKEIEMNQYLNDKGEPE